MTTSTAANLSAVELLDILAIKLGTDKENVAFILGEKRDQDSSIAIPDFREMLSVQ